DGRPLPVLGFCLFAGFWALSMPLGMPFTHFTTIFLGFVVSGFLGFAAILFMSVYQGYLAWGFWNRKLHAWWAAVVFYTLLYLPIAFSFTPDKMKEMYGAMGYPPERIEESVQALQGFPMVWGMLLFVAVVMGFLIYVKRFFPKAS